TFADNEVELEILHRRIEHFLDRRTQTMDLVDEQDVPLFEIGQKCGEIAGLGDHRPRSGTKADAEFARHDLRQRGLAEAGWSDEQHVVECLAALARRLDEYRKVGTGLLLADEIRQRLRTHGGITDIIGTALWCDKAGGRIHFANSFKPSRIN